MNDDQENVAEGPRWRRLLPLLAIASGFAAFFALGLGDYLSFQALAANREHLLAWRDDNIILAALSFMAAYAVLTAFSVPVGLWMTLAGGFMFGTLAGGMLALIGATIGATAIFLAARYAFGDILRKKAGPAIAKMEAGFRDDELTYMFILRLVPLFPFWLVNLVPAFLNVSTRTYVLGTLFGMIPGGMVYASVGNGLGAVFETGSEPDLGIIFSAPVLLPIIGLAALSLIPVIYKKVKKK